MSDRPAYRDLPGGRVQGLWGADDQRGCLNLLTPERVRAAAGLVRSGATFGLDAPIDYPHAVGIMGRRAPDHVVVRYDWGRDEYYDGFWPQLGSQWDGFLHIADTENGCFHNGNTDESRGIGLWSARGIVGRGVLLDAARWAERQGAPIDWRTRHCVTVSDLERIAADQGVEITEGTILILRTGWETGWTAASDALRREIVEGDEFHTPGVDPSPEMVERLWDWGVAAVAADNLAFEASPGRGYMMHVDLLTRLGIPIGEFWHVDELAAECAREGRYEFLFTSAPMNSPAGIGSTANALAIL